jgi:hypothetical protein
MISPRLCALATTLALLVAGPAFAERRVSIMVDPIFLVVPMVDATVEVEPTPHLGLSATAGYGRVAVLIPNAMYNLQLESNVYLFRPFQGWHLGTELAYWGGSSGGALFPGGPKTMDSTSSIYIAGIMGGYKWMTRGGFTAVIQYGVGRMHETSTSGGRKTELAPLANLNFGWSL